MKGFVPSDTGGRLFWLKCVSAWLVTEVLVGSVSPEPAFSSSGGDTMTTILMTTDVDSFFGDAVESAIASRGVSASDSARQYLVAVLADFALKEPRSFEKPVTFLLDEALSSPPEERLERLKTVGDGTLYVTGFFPEHLDARGVDPSYLARVGATAYGAASNLLAQGGDGLDLFGELSRRFGEFVKVLRDVADGLFAHQTQNAESVVKLYERWLKTGSASLGQALAAQGLVPMKPSGGLS
jgi:hypothetical protein